MVKNKNPTQRMDLNFIINHYAYEYNDQTKPNEILINIKIQRFQNLQLYAMELVTPASVIQASTHANIMLNE